jgi:hypothetical protein
MRNHEKVIELIALVFYKNSVKQSTWARIQDIAIVLIEESVRDVSVDKNIKDTRVITLGELT